MKHSSVFFVFDDTVWWEVQAYLLSFSQREIIIYSCNMAAKLTWSYFTFSLAFDAWSAHEQKVYWWII